MAATAVPFRGLICAAPVLSHPRAQRATHALFGLLGMLSHMLPLPLTPWVTHTPAEECAALLTFMQWSVGTAVPLLVSGFQEARLFQFHQLQRWQAGLPLESGWQASIYDFLWW